MVHFGADDAWTQTAFAIDLSGTSPKITATPEKDTETPEKKQELATDILKNADGKYAYAGKDLFRSKTMYSQLCTMLTADTLTADGENNLVTQFTTLLTEAASDSDAKAVKVTAADGKQKSLSEISFGTLTTESFAIKDNKITVKDSGNIAYTFPQELFASLKFIQYPAAAVTTKTEVAKTTTTSSVDVVDNACEITGV